MRTYRVKPADIKRKTQVIDASENTLGRLATRVAGLLMGKHKAIFTPNEDTGDFVVVFNAEKVRVTGKKVQQKLYYRHSGYPGGFRITTLDEMMRTNPTGAVEHAVKGMLPHTRLGAKMLRKLTVYPGEVPQPAKKTPVAAAKKE